MRGKRGADEQERRKRSGERKGRRSVGGRVGGMRSREWGGAFERGIWRFG